MDAERKDYVMMTGLERTFAALKLKQYDMVSPQPEIDVAYAAKLAGLNVGEAFCDEKKHAAALNNVFNVHDVDGIYINLCLTDKDIKEYNKTDERIIIKDHCDAIWEFDVNDIGTIKTRDIKTLDDERLYNVNPYIFGAVDIFKQIDKKWIEEKAIIAGITGAYSHVVFLYGLEKTMMAMFDEPEKLHNLLEVRLRYALERIDELADLGCKLMWIGEGTASGSLISPQMYEKFVLPYQKSMVEHMRQRGVLNIIHICGDINNQIKSIRRTNANGLDLDYMNDLHMAKDIMNEKMCIKGNINPVDLQTSSAKEIINTCKEKINVFPENKGFILSTGCLVTRDTPPDNIEAMVEACRESNGN